MGMNTEDDAEESGRAIVREVFVERLRLCRLRPHRGVTVAQQDKLLGHLVEFLSYMARDNLHVLAEAVLSHAADPKGSNGAWPADILIRQWALGLQAKPFEQHPIVASWLRSREGPLAEAGGYLVELLDFLLRNRRAVLVGDLNRIKAEAGENQRILARVRDRISKGIEWADDRKNLEAYLRKLERARQYVQEGQDRRAAQQVVA